MPSRLNPFQVLPAAIRVATMLLVKADSANGFRVAAGEGRPDTDAVTSATELVSAMRRLKCWSGLSYRQLESRAARLGLALPRSTLTNALHRETLPREDLLAAFVRACGCGEAEAARWLVVRRRLAMAGTGGPPVTAPRPLPRPRHAVVALLTAVLMFAVAAIWLMATQ